MTIDASLVPGRSVGCRGVPGVLAVLLVGCASIHARPAPPGTATIAGSVRLVPHEGVRLPAGGGAYGDRALRDAELVDYSRPGFAVVSVAGLPSPAGTATLALRASRFGVRFEPRFAAVGLGGNVVIRNDTPSEHVVSCPPAGLLKSLEAGATTTVAARDAGELRLFDLGGGGDAGGGEVAEASVYVAPGPFTVVADDGSFELAGLAPPSASSTGPRGMLLEVWHPRFPPLERPVILVPDATQRFDLELQVR
jgi:hypothetical protein